MCARLHAGDAEHGRILRMRFITRQFNLLTPREIFAMYRLRSDVFVVEQQCVYPDVDEKDLVSHHMLVNDKESLVAYCRIIPPGVSYPEPSIGRVVVAAQKRGNGLGRELMKHALNKSAELFHGQDIVISAQTYLRRFYETLRFTAEGDEYPEDGIPHIKMRKVAVK
jgi:ElaA protein